MPIPCITDLGTNGRIGVLILRKIEERFIAESGIQSIATTTGIEQSMTKRIYA